MFARHSRLAALAGVLCAALAIAPALAQPTGQLSGGTVLIPTATVPSATITVGVASTYVIQTNGAGAVFIRIAGSPTGLAATVEGTEARAGTPAWTQLPADTVGGVRLRAITTTGLYRINTAGLAQVRLNVSALTSGATTVSMSAGAGEQFVNTLPQPRATYSAAATIATGGTANFLVVAGSATKTVRILGATCSGKATAALAVNITATKHSTADTGDAGTAVTATPHDSANLAATATVVSHTTSPTPGTLVGALTAGTLALVVAATPITPANVLAFRFGNGPGEQEVVLRGVTQEFALSTDAAFGTGAAVPCRVTWTED